MTVGTPAKTFGSPDYLAFSSSSFLWGIPLTTGKHCKKVTNRPG
jgi:hypothetical protein